MNHDPKPRTGLYLTAMAICAVIAAATFLYSIDSARNAKRAKTADFVTGVMPLGSPSATAMAVKVPCPATSTGSAPGTDHVGECLTQMPVTTLTMQNLPGVYDPRIVKRDSRRQARIWPDLNQNEIDTITTGLKTLKARPIVVLCSDEKYCGDLAADLENAFESAKWTIDLQKPLVDNGDGITVDDEGVAQLLKAATKERFPITVTLGAPPTNPGNFTTIAIGKRPRG